MISAAQLALDSAEAGVKPARDGVPAYQWRLRWDELQPLCPSMEGARLVAARI